MPQLRVKIGNAGLIPLTLTARGNTYGARGPV
jgi:hypothetical protein